MREQAEDALVAGVGAAEIMGLSMRGTDRQRGGKKQQEGQRTSER